MSQYYILVGKKPKAVDESRWKRAKAGDTWRRVGHTKVEDALVSTVFLGINHSYDDGPPVLFETMVFGGVLDEMQERCSTWEQAEAMHKAMCERVAKAGEN